MKTTSPRIHANTFNQKKLQITYQIYMQNPPKIHQKSYIFADEPSELSRAYASAHTHAYAGVAYVIQHPLRARAIIAGVAGAGVRGDVRARGPAALARAL